VKESDAGKIFLDQSLFEGKEEGLKLYESKDENFIKFFSVISLALFGFNLYSWYYGESDEDEENSLYLSIIFGSLFLLSQYRFYK
jgi:hypothetical protein